MLKFQHVNKLYYTCAYSRLPEDKPSGSKRVEEIVKMNKLIEHK